MDDFCLLSGEPNKVADGISIKNPTIRQIRAYGEQRYFALVQNICATPADKMVELWDTMHVYWDSVDEYELFTAVFHSLQHEDLSIVFDGLDAESFQLSVTDLKGTPILRNRDGVCIDRAVHKVMTDYLRTLLLWKKNVIRPADDFTRDTWIEVKREDLEDARSEKFASILKPLVSSIIFPGSQYTWETAQDMPIGVLMDSTVRLGKRDKYEHLLQGIYAGTVDVKKINKKDLEWST